MKNLVRVLIPLLVVGCASGGKVAMKDDSQINVAELMMTARLEPYPNEKKPEGVMISKIEPKSNWDRIGFKNGDIAVRVGEEPLVNRDALTSLFRAVENAGSQPIEVLRWIKGVKCRSKIVLPHKGYLRASAFQPVCS